MKRLHLTLLFAFLLCMDLSAQDNSNILKKLEGSWQAKGKAFNMPADITMVWEPALMGKFVRINYKMEMKRADGKVQVFEGTGMYQPTGDTTYRATWFDSGGEMHPIKATSDGVALTSIWGTPETKLGKTIYLFKGSDNVEVTDFIMLKDGTWKEFNRNVVARRK
jgi:hypothetical protein